MHTINNSRAKTNERAEKIPHSSYYLYNISKNYNAQKSRNNIRKRMILNATTTDKGFQFRKKTSDSNMTSKNIVSSSSHYKARRVHTGLNKT
jgi:hypothetical protein